MSEKICHVELTAIPGSRIMTRSGSGIAAAGEPLAPTLLEIPHFKYSTNVQ